MLRMSVDGRPFQRAAFVLDVAAAGGRHAGSFVRQVLPWRGGGSQFRPTVQWGGCFVARKGGAAASLLS